jgi:hypothetical protein
LHPPAPPLAAHGNRARFRSFGPLRGGCPVLNPDPVAQSPLRRRSGSETRQRRGMSIRLLPDEHAAISEKARAAGMSIASYIRACALGDAGPRARRSPPINAELLAHAVAALNKAGSNLNQIARALNSTQAVGARESAAALSDTRKAVVRILEIVGRADRL